MYSGRFKNVCGISSDKEDVFFMEIGLSAPQITPIRQFADKPYSINPWESPASDRCLQLFFFREKETYSIACNIFGLLQFIQCNIKCFI